MSERMTSVCLPNAKHTGIADWGRKTPAEMIKQIREHAQFEKAAAEEILMASDEEFRVETYTGVYVQRNKETLQEGRS